MEIAPPETNLGKTCESILRDLPQWFGIEQSIVDYVHQIDSLPTITAIDNSEAIGFISMNILFEKSADFHVLGVKKSYHRTGVGKKLFQAAEQYLKGQGIKFVQVKTISGNSADPHYAETRKFYKAMGYTALEEFPELWGRHNPCLQMIKHL